MANTYYLNAVHIDCASGTPKVSVNVAVIDALTGQTSGLDRAPDTVSQTVQNHLNAIVADALAYIQSKFPGITITLPPSQ